MCKNAYLEQNKDYSETLALTQKSLEQSKLLAEENTALRSEMDSFYRDPIKMGLVGVLIGVLLTGVVTR